MLFFGVVILLHLAHMKRPGAEYRFIALSRKISGEDEEDEEKEEVENRDGYTWNNPIRH